MKHKQKPNNHQGDGRNQQTKSGPEQDGNKESHEGAKHSNEESNKDMQIPKGHSRMSRIWSIFRYKIARNCFQVLTIVIGLLGIIVGSIVADIYYRQLIDMDGQLGIMQTTTIIDQRPWIRITMDDEPHLFQRLNGKEQLVLPIQLNIVNMGKTPARKVHIDTGIDFPKSGDSGFIDYHRDHNVITYPIMMPQGTGDILVQYFNEKHLISPIPDLVGQDMLKGSRYVIIYARATYRDSFGIDHWTQYCADEAEVAMTTHSENCVNYNDTDNNQKPN
jgi:hypothetical protein